MTGPRRRIPSRRLGRGLRAAAAAAVIAVPAAWGGVVGGQQARAGDGGQRIGAIRLWRIPYRAHDGRSRAAFVLAPAWYGHGRHPVLPLIIAPHGRGVDGRANARLWGQLPGRGGFLVVSPDGEGDHLPLYSWGARGQVSDLAAMPRHLRRTLPWLRVDAHRIYAVGGSMGGQEALLLAARAPRLLAGVAAFDATTDLARQYRSFPSLPCNAACLRRWQGPIGEGLQALAREEVGGTPAEVPGAYAARSPISYGRAIARSGVQLQLWWSTSDAVVSSGQSKAFLHELARWGSAERVTVVKGTWQHAAAMRVNLQAALRRFGLLPDGPPRAAG